MLVSLKKAEEGARGKHENEEAIWDVGRKSGMSRAMVNRIIEEMFWKCGRVPPESERQEGSKWYKAIHGALHFHKIYFETNFVDVRHVLRAASYVRSYDHLNVEDAFIRPDLSRNPLLYERFVTSLFENVMATSKSLKILFPDASMLPTCSVLRTNLRKGFVTNSGNETEKLRELDRMNFCFSLTILTRELPVLRVLSTEADKSSLRAKGACVGRAYADGSVLVFQKCQITPLVEVLYQISNTDSIIYAERARILSKNQKRFESQGVVPRLQFQGALPILTHDEAILFAKHPTINLFLPMEKEYATSEVGLTMLMKTVSLSHAYGQHTIFNLDLHKEMVSRLLRGGADPNKADLAGRTALAYLSRTPPKHRETIGSLHFMHGAKINMVSASPDGKCRTPLDFVFLDDIDVEHSALVHPCSILYLLLHGARILVTDIHAREHTSTYDLYLLAVALGPPNYTNHVSIRGLSNELIFKVGEMLLEG